MSLGECHIHILTQEGMRFHELLRKTTTTVMDLVVGQVTDTGAVLEGRNVHKGKKTMESKARPTLGGPEARNKSYYFLT